MYLFDCLYIRSVLGNPHEPLNPGIDYNVNLLWSSKHIFNFLHFVIQKL